MKRSLVNFESVVKAFTMIMTNRMHQRFLSKVRGYMLTYLHKLIQKKEEDDNIKHANDSKLVIWTYQYNEKIHNIYPGHRDMNCIDGQFGEKVMCQDIEGNREANLIQDYNDSFVGVCQKHHLEFKYGFCLRVYLHAGT